MESVRVAQHAVDEAIKDGQRTRRRCIGGEMKLREVWADPAVSPGSKAHWAKMREAVVADERDAAQPPGEAPDSPPEAQDKLRAELVRRRG